MSVTLRVPPLTAKHHVYIAWGRRKRALYVGQSISVIYRIGQHYDKSPWASDVVRWEIIPCDSASEMAKFEANLIGDLNPPHNKQRPSAPWTVPPVVADGRS